jgi:hypothetical protein
MGSTLVCAVGGDITGDQCHGNQNQRGSKECWRVGGFDAAGRLDRSRVKANASAVPMTTPINVNLNPCPTTSLSTSRFSAPSARADDDFVRAPTGGIRNQPVKSDGSERQRQSQSQSGKEAER